MALRTPRLLSGDLAFVEAHAGCTTGFATFAAAIALDEGFEVNFRKTRVMRRATRQRVCGLVVNERPNLARAAGVTGLPREG